MLQMSIFVTRIYRLFAIADTFSHIKVSTKLYREIALGSLFIMIGWEGNVLKVITFTEMLPIQNNSTEFNWGTYIS